MTTSDRKKLLDEWRAHCQRVQALTAIDTSATESVAERDRRIRHLQQDYAAFCEYYFPHFLTLRDKATGQVIRTVHNAPFHNQAARLIKGNSSLRAVFMWPRAHAKSTHMGVFSPSWLLFQRVRLIDFMVIVGKSEDAAVRLLGDIKAELEFNQRLIADFGVQKSTGDWMDGEFRTQSGCKFLAVGRGQSPRGLRDRQARPDYILIDDLDDDELCRNDKRVKDLTAWVREALFGSLDVGRGRFIMVGNLISKNSVLYNIAHAKGVHLSRVQAVDKDGNPVWAEKWTKEEARLYAEFVGYRAWQKEMMHNPIQDGTIFRAEWIQWRRPLPMGQYVQLICYTDPSFKARKNDYKASVLLGRRPDGSIDILRVMCRQCSVAEMVRWLYHLYEELCLPIPTTATTTATTPATVPGHTMAGSPAPILFMMEAVFAQDILLDDFEAEGRTRGYQLPLHPDRRPKPDKLARIEAVSPLWERGLVWYNQDYQDTPDMQALIDQTLALERGGTAHDDGPDACEGGIWYLQRAARQHTVEPRFSKRKSPRNVW